MVCGGGRGGGAEPLLPDGHAAGAGGLPPAPQTEAARLVSREDHHHHGEAAGHCVLLLQAVRGPLEHLRFGAAAAQPPHRLRDRGRGLAAAPRPAPRPLHGGPGQQGRALGLAAAIRGSSLLRGGRQDAAWN